MQIASPVYRHDNSAISHKHVRVLENTRIYHSTVNSCLRGIDSLRASAASLQFRGDNDKVKEGWRRFGLFGLNVTTCQRQFAFGRGDNDFGEIAMNVAAA